jgi:hypothetical protein
MRRFALPSAFLIGFALLSATPPAVADQIQIPAVTTSDVTATTTTDTAVTIMLNATSSTDGATLAYIIDTPPSHGSLGSPGTDGSILYTPDRGFEGSDSFTYKATQSIIFSSNVSTVAIVVSPAVVADVTPPEITPPATQSFATSTLPAAFSLTPATATDDTDPNPVITYAPLTFDVGTTTVVWTATDASGNSASTTSLVVVIDSTAVVTPDPAPSPGPLGNGPPVGYLPAPVNPPPPESAPSAPAVPAPTTALTEDSTASYIAPTGTTTVDTAVLASSSETAAVISTTSTNVSRTVSQPTQNTAVVTAPAAQPAAVAAAVPHRSVDYIGLLIMLFLVLLATLYEWRRSKRDSRSAL